MVSFYKGSYPLYKAVYDMSGESTLNKFYKELSLVKTYTRGETKKTYVKTGSRGKTKKTSSAQDQIAEIIDKYLPSRSLDYQYSHHFLQKSYPLQ